MVLAALLAIISNSMAQDDLLSATLHEAKQLRDAGDFNQAVLELQSFNDEYPGNIWVMRMWAETLFWMNNFNDASWVYEEAMRKHPENLEVKYDYALMLFEEGNYPKAREVLIVYTDNNAENAGAESLLGITNYYLGYFKQAYTHLEKSLSLNPADKRIFSLK